MEEILIIKKTREWFKKVFFIQDGSKQKLNKKPIALSFVIFFIIGLGFSIFDELTEDTSIVIVKKGGLREDELIGDKNTGTHNRSVGNLPIGETRETGKSGTSNKKARGGGSQGQYHRPRLQIKYQAKQVITREGNFSADQTIPTGTNLIGKLLTSIDTREKSQIYKVLLPYGGRSKFGAEIPKNTTLYGKIRYPGRGKKVFLKFTQGILPSGREIKLEAQALSSSDYSPGLVGEFHGKSGTRIATALGLTMVSGMADVLVEKKEAGPSGAVVAKETLKNGFYKGLADSAAAEAARQASELNAEAEYVTIESGTDLIVNLTRSYKQYE